MGLSRAEALKILLVFPSFWCLQSVRGAVLLHTGEELLSAPTLTLANAFGSLVGGAKSCRPGLGVTIPFNVRSLLLYLSHLKWN